MWHGVWPCTAPPHAKTTQDKQLFLQQCAHTTSCTKIPVSCRHIPARKWTEKDTGSRLWGPYTCISAGGYLGVSEEGKHWCEEANRGHQEYFMAHHLGGKTKTKAEEFCGIILFCSCGCEESKATHTTHRYSSTNVRLQRPHTLTIPKKKQKGFQQNHPSESERDAGKAERRSGQSETVCTFCVTLQQPPAGWHYAWLTCSANQFKKKKTDRGLYLRALWLHVHFHSSTVRVKKTKNLPPHQHVWIHITEEKRKKAHWGKKLTEKIEDWELKQKKSICLTKHNLKTFWSTDFRTEVDVITQQMN